MTLEQAYINSLNIPAIELKIFNKHFNTVFKRGKILTNSYVSMLKKVPKHNGFYILCHNQTIFTFCFIKNDIIYLIGPEIINYNRADKHLNLDSKIVYLSKRLNTIILEKIQCYQQILFFSQLIKLPLNNDNINEAFKHAISSSQLDDFITTMHFKDEGLHISYVYERALKSAVMLGDPSAIHSIFVALINSGRIGVLSDKGQIRSIKNWGIICVSVTIRAAINAGIDWEQAYSLNDQYVMSIESFNAFDDIINKIEEIIQDMAWRVQHLTNVNLSKNTRHIYQIIMDSPETKLTIIELSNQIGVSGHYLSTMFKREVGISISHFKLLVRVNRAIQLISTTNLPMSEIAAKLNFSDQAHLSRAFKSFVGVSPSVSRKNPYYTENWNMYDFMNINVG